MPRHAAGLVPFQHVDAGARLGNPRVRGGARVPGEPGRAGAFRGRRRQGDPFRSGAGAPRNRGLLHRQYGEGWNPLLGHRSARAGQAGRMAGRPRGSVQRPASRWTAPPRQSPARGFCATDRGLPPLAARRPGRYTGAGMAVLSRLLEEPYLSTRDEHQGLLLHSVYHRPNGWDHVPAGRGVPCGESSMWGDYHVREAALCAQRMINGSAPLLFWKKE